MARKRAGETSKSDLIRSTSAENPTAGPTEVARMIQTAHSIKVSPAMVSTVLSQDRTRGGKPAKRGRPPKSESGSNGKSASASSSSASSASKLGRKPAAQAGGVTIETLLRIKKLADELGGVNEAKKALDALSQILG